MIDCPPGYYCPASSREPTECPKGTYNPMKNQKSVQSCKPCPAGTACNVEGVAEFARMLCPPGYYCLEGSWVPTACPIGTFRPNRGG